jgi:predicted nucleic acid-binding protein
MLTVWPFVTEAMFLLSDAGGWDAQAGLWVMVRTGALEITESSPHLERIAVLMEKYRDAPMALADAALVALAAVKGIKRIFTLDSDFGIYRYRGREAFVLVA